MDTHMDTSIDIHMDMSMDIHMEMPIKSKVSKLDGLYIQSEPAASLALRRWSNNPSAEGRWKRHPELSVEDVLAAFRSVMVDARRDNGTWVCIGLDGRGCNQLT